MSDTATLNVEAAIERSMRVSAQAATALARSMPLKPIADIVKFVDACIAAQGRVITTGVGKSAVPARKMASTLCSIGVPAYFLHPNDAGHGELGLLSERDIVFAFSKSGSSEELWPICGRTHTILISADHAPTLPHNRLIMIPPMAEGCPLERVPLSSVVMMIMIADAITVGLMVRNNVDADEHRSLHPLGELGRK